MDEEPWMRRDELVFEGLGSSTLLVEALANMLGKVEYAWLKRLLDHVTCMKLKRMKNYLEVLHVPLPLKPLLCFLMCSFLFDRPFHTLISSPSPSPSRVARALHESIWQWVFLFSAVEEAGWGSGWFIPAAPSTPISPNQTGQSGQSPYLNIVHVLGGNTTALNTGLLSLALFD
ncbi:hypothetical protein BDQ17DRAFT_1333958 [Cyathus striatus]|nr:hypothetical protein BDQ17DRAFT_1333958 [Cyathus striatus]